MRKLARILVVASAAIAAGLWGVGQAQAQMAAGNGPQLSFHGDIEAAFGAVGWGESNGSQAAGKASTELFEADEVQLRGDVKVNDQLSGFFNMRFWNLTNANSNANGATPGTVPAGEPFKTVGSTVFAELHWKATDNFEIAAGNFDYPLWSAPMTQEAILFTTPAAYFIIPNHGVSPLLGGVSVWIQENQFLWNGIHGADFNFTFGGTQVGLALSPQCTGLGVSACNSAGAGQQLNTQSIVPHLYGTYGDLTVNAQIDLDSATDAATAGTKTISTSSTGWAIGARYAINPTMRIAADIQSLDVAKVALLNETEDQVYNNFGLRFDVGGLMIQYFTSIFNPLFDKAAMKTAFGSETITNSVGTIRYAIPTTSGITFMPEIKSETLGKQGVSASGKAEDFTITQADVIARLGF